MKVYIAGPFAWKDVLDDVACCLEDIGHEITSSWLTTAESDDDTDLVKRGGWAVRDLDEIGQSDVLVKFTRRPSSDEVCRLGTGGKDVEHGAALVLGIPCIVVGPAVNVFDCHPDVVRLADEAELYRWMEGGK